jgi:succinate dehydrogenase / fumarate reductase iron-sulfur subunit
MANERVITFRIRRFSPEKDSKPHWELYHVPYAPGMTVLDGLWKAKETDAPGLAWRASCRMGVCGSCGMMINGSPSLACNTQISELGTDEISLAPLPNFDILRDLVPDLRPMLDAHREMMPFILREDVQEQEKPTGEFMQTPHEMERYLQFSYCIKCGCCMSACPTYAAHPDVYHGPMPLTQAQRYNSDSRDGGFNARRRVLAGESGPWRCHYAGECSRVCPKGVDPAKAIQLLKRSMVLDVLKLRRRRRPAGLAKVPEGVGRRDGIADAPERTI